VSEARVKRMTSEAFLAWVGDRPDGERYELVAGEVVAMAPERNRHNLAKLDAALALREAVHRAGQDCVVLGDGATVVIDEATVYEPDAVVQRDAQVDLEASVVEAPTIVVEVLSPATRSVDTGGKLIDYFRLASVRHYLVVDPGRRCVVHHARQDDGIATKILREGRLRLEPPGFAVDVGAFFASV